jgi:molybdopterin converting factor small subunit
MSLQDDRYRRASAALVVGLLLATAGCSSILGSGASGPTATPTNGTQQTPESTPAPVPTDTETGPEHGHGNETETNVSSSMTGQMRVVVAGDELDVAGEDSEAIGFQFDENGAYRWSAESDNVTLAEALSTLDIDATDDRLTYDGETYRESTRNVTLSYRVDGESVDPTERTLSDGDEVWVFVRTPETNLSVPGEHIPHERLHVHGEIEFVVNGTEVDFSRERYQQPSHQRHFHFENGEADPWHAHSWAVTLGYAMDTLRGIDVSNDSVTYNGTTFEESDPGVDVTVRVNGEPVAPDEYVLKDGDSVRIVVETEAAG